MKIFSSKIPVQILREGRRGPGHFGKSSNSDFFLEGFPYHWGLTCQVKYNIVASLSLFSLTLPSLLPLLQVKIMFFVYISFRGVLVTIFNRFLETDLDKKCTWRVYNVHDELLKHIIYILAWLSFVWLKCFQRLVLQHN